MLNPTTDDLRRRRLIIAGIGIALLLIVFTTYAVLVQRSHTTGTTPADTAHHTGDLPPVDTKPVVTELPALAPTSNPEGFARQAAEAVFAWDTTTLVTRTDHVEQLVTVADPTGESTPGLVSDLDNYLPTQGAWIELARYETRQWLSIDSVTLPTKWAEAQAQGGDELLPGTTALTIHGTRHREGIWEDEPVASQHTVTFTVFVVCAPSYPKCHLLRLSMLDKPLD